MLINIYVAGHAATQESVKHIASGSYTMVMMVSRELGKYSLRSKCWAKELKIGLTFCCEKAVII